jgi:hypothetical protein
MRNIEGILAATTLRSLSLSGAPVCRSANYRHYVIARLPYLQVLGMLLPCLHLVWFLTSKLPPDDKPINAGERSHAYLMNPDLKPDVLPELPPTPPPPSSSSPGASAATPAGTSPSVPAVAPLAPASPLQPTTSNPAALFDLFSADAPSVVAVSRPIAPTASSLSSDAFFLAPSAPVTYLASLLYHILCSSQVRPSVFCAQ